MAAEYLLFNLSVIAGPLALSFWRPTRFVHRWGRVFAAALAVAIPYIVWDALVAGRHWDFNPKFVLGVRLFGLPIEEIMFFFTVPAACMFAWETLCKPHRASTRRPKRPARVALALPLAAAGAWMWICGKEYTSLALLALAFMVVLDRVLDTRLLGDRRFAFYVAIVSGATLLFNNYLTGRPIVVYDLDYQLDWHVGTMPIEDLLYGLGLNYGVLSVYEALKDRRRRRGEAGVDGFPGDPSRWTRASTASEGQPRPTP